ncbi:MAG TPA: hydroxymethylbilane synthase [Solirubrobacteraceae bacterium]|nr:hydroxymethylbilane synthase [Solirubrobacteraceae bacterium]
MKIGTRGSALALAQARLVTQRISPWSLGDAGLEVVVVNTSGDGLRVGERPGGDKSRWVAELEHALLAGEIDLAVHSAKDVPGDLVDGLELLGSPVRDAPEDALIGVASLEDLPEQGCVGTSSVRRRAQLLAARADLEVVSLRGNVDTRLRKLANEVSVAEDQQPQRRPGQFDAIVLASAGLRRLGRRTDIGCALDTEHFVPAPGQGALALQARAGDEATRAIVTDMIDAEATACLTAERAVARALGASCNTPLGAHAVAVEDRLRLRAWVGLPDGSEWVLDELDGGLYDAAELGERMAERLTTAGAPELLRRAEEMAVGGA